MSALFLYIIVVLFVKADEKEFNNMSGKPDYIQLTTAITEQLEPQREYIGRFKITYYCPCEKCCGKSDGITASGTTAKEGRTIATDTRIIPFETEVYIEGLGYFVAEDRGGAIKQNKIDIYLDSHDECLQRGVDYADVYI